MRRSLFMLLAVVLLTVSTASAEIVRVEVHSRVDLAGGKAYGLAGVYEKLVGTIYFEVDPAHSANRIIADIDLAPRNRRGKVEFHSNFFLIKPKDVTRGNGTVLYEVSNRGGKGMLRYFNRGQGSIDPETEAHMGDGFLMRNGFTLLWLGWQFDPPVRDGLVRVYPRSRPMTGSRSKASSGAKSSSTGGCSTRLWPIATTSPTSWRTRMTRPT